jgi:hypothetical protein
MLWILALFGLITGVTASPARAQLVQSFPELQLRLDLQDKVTVIDTGGTTWRGRLIQVTREQLVVRVDSRDVALGRDRVQQVRVCCDSLLNGTLIGLGAGATLGALAAVDFSGHRRAGDAVAGALIFGAIGTGLGLGFDALIRGDVVIYRAAPLTIDVVTSAARRRVELMVRWSSR